MMTEEAHCASPPSQTDEKTPMNIDQLSEILTAQQGADAVTAPVVARFPDGKHYFIHDASFSRPMVKASASPSAPMIDGRRNATKYAALDANIAFYPTTKEARESALQARHLRDLCKHAVSDREILLHQGTPGGTPIYRHVTRFALGRISATGRPEVVSRGGVPAMIVDCA